MLVLINTANAIEVAGGGQRRAPALSTELFSASWLCCTCRMASEQQGLTPRVPVTTRCRSPCRVPVSQWSQCDIGEAGLEIQRCDWREGRDGVQGPWISGVNHDGWVHACATWHHAHAHKKPFGHGRYQVGPRYIDPTNVESRIWDCKAENKQSSFTRCTPYEFHTRGVSELEN